MSLQYGVHYGVHQDQNFYKLNYRFLMKARHVHSTQKRKFVKFLQYIKKKCRNCFYVLLWCKTFRYFTGFQSCLLLLEYINILSNILRKSIATVFVFYCDAKHSDTLRGSSHLCYLFLQTFQPSRFYEVSPGFWYAVPVSGIESICPGFYISQQKKFHIYIIFHQQCKTIHL